jgi:hypothetical protein
MSIPGSATNSGAHQSSALRALGQRASSVELGERARHALAERQ